MINARVHVRRSFVPPSLMIVLTRQYLSTASRIIPVTDQSIDLVTELINLFIMVYKRPMVHGVFSPKF